MAGRFWVALGAACILMACGGATPTPAAPEHARSAATPVAVASFPRLRPIVGQPDADSPFARDTRAEAILGQISEAAGNLRLLVNEARAQKDIVKLNCLNDKTTQILTLERNARESRNLLRTASIADDGSGDAQWGRLVVFGDRARQLQKEALQCVGQESAYAGGGMQYRIDGPIVNARLVSGVDSAEPTPAQRRLADIQTQTDRLKGSIARTKVRMQLERESVLGGAIDEKSKNAEVAFNDETAVSGKDPSGAAGGQQSSSPAVTTIPPAAAAHDGSLLIRSAQLALAVFEVDKNVDAVETVAKEAGGYLALRGDRQITIRVPKGRFEEAVKRIEKLGDVLHRNIAAEDVTDQYVDLEMRLKNAHAVRTRLETLLTSATVKDAVEIQKELAKVTEEIERYEGKLKLLRDRVAFATITVSFEQQQSQQVKTQALLPFPWMSVLGLQPLLYVPR